MTIEIRQDTGYGLIPKRIMRDKTLSIQSKAIYSYLASFAGNTGQAFPSVSLMLSELNISRDTFYKYRNELEEVGAITVKKERTIGKFERNIYLLHNSINAPCPKSSDTVKPDTVSSTTVSSDTISNSLKSNSLKSNSSSSSDNPLSISKDLKRLMKLFESGGFGPLNSYVGERISSLMEDYQTDWIEDAMKTSIDSNVRKLTYVESILKRWQAEGKGNQKQKANDPYAGMEVY